MARGQNIGVPPARKRRIKINKLIYKALKCDEIYLWKVPYIVTSFFRYGLLQLKLSRRLSKSEGQ